MSDTKRGYAMLITAGDEEISRALASGIVAVRGYGSALSPADAGTSPPRWGSEGTGDLIRTPATATSPIGGRLSEEQIRVVKAELDIQKAANLLRVAMHPEPVDYAGKVFDAEMAYGESVYLPGPMRKLGEKLLLAYALAVLAFQRLFKSVGV